jgi:mono/diheme cytochrome c family protein
MRQRRLPLKIALLSLLIFAFDARAQDKIKPVSPGSVDRGKYIVEQIAMCSECHTPRDTTGKLQTSAYLLGAAIPVPAPPFANRNWALRAPAIAGLTGYSDQQGIRLLMEGVTANGRQPSPPMPRFRMNRADAEAVVTYLKSIK